MVGRGLSLDLNEKERSQPCRHLGEKQPGQRELPEERVVLGVDAGQRDWVGEPFKGSLRGTPGGSFVGQGTSGFRACVLF